jgi:hypothetical protein
MRWKLWGSTAGRAETAGAEPRGGAAPPPGGGRGGRGGGGGGGGEVLEALEGEGEMGAPLRAGHGVDLVDDDVAHRRQHGGGPRRQDQIERFGGGDQDVGRVAGHRPPVLGGRVPGSRRHPDVAPLDTPPVDTRPGRGEAGRLPGYADERRPQVAFDVVGEGLERADVEDAATVLGRRRRQQPVEGPEEGGEGFPRTRGRQDERVLPALDGGPPPRLGRRRALEGGVEPRSGRRREGHIPSVRGRRLFTFS